MINNLELIRGNVNLHILKAAPRKYHSDGPDNLSKTGDRQTELYDSLEEQ